MLGEEGSEAQNKFYRKFRLSHARKFSRESNLTDIFFRVLDASDPMISNISLESRMRKRKRFSIPQEVQDLLATLDAPEIATEFEDEDEDDSGLQETTKHLDIMELPAELEVN